MTRILADHRRSLKQLQTNEHKDVKSTSTSNKQQECINSNTKSMVPDLGWFDGD